MINKFTLTTDEVIASTSAVETLMESDNASAFGLRFPPDVKQEVCTSCLKKLESYTPLTYFSKQEYIMIYYALEYIINTGESFGIFINDAYTASEKIGKLAGLL